MSVLAALDKFKGTATSTELGAAVARAARAAGLDADAIVVSDGGDGLLEVFGGPNQQTGVTGPLGETVAAPWRLDGERAVIESALASGLVLAGGAAGNDPVAATSRGTGELVEAAIRAGATRIVLGVGGSACTDGGLGAVAALSDSVLDALRDRRVTITVCCDVDTRYEDAARVFGPQKGADPDQVAALARRLRDARAALLARFGVDVGAVPGGGAAGGLAGGLAAVGAQLRPGFELAAAESGLPAAVASADLVVTGEGRLDAESFAGKVVGGVVALARAAGTDVVAIVGDLAPGIAVDFPVVSLVDRFGVDRATRDAVACVEIVARELLTAR
ncbi:MAG TPA: glycerate kinase [Jatrophihabitans sp.]|jgi:glycerate kinase|uniref:glycerate kinase n=1 Tax=Jatrophihabitans sp. TaxID=1932789 RepID=UPI002E0314C5|nr:glycerate kinase [Jatrophihabitans sp.]